MTRHIAALLSGLLLLCINSAVAGPVLEPFRYGDIEVRLPKGWGTEVHYAPGVRVLVARETPDQPDTSSDLLWLEATPLLDIGPKEFVEAFLATLDVSYRVVRAKTSARAYEVLLEGRAGEHPMKASLLSYASGSRHYLHVASALPERFDELDGMKLRADSFPAPAAVEASFTDSAVRNNPGKVRIRANGFSLTEAMIADTLTFGEFLATHTFTTSERQELRRNIVAEFNSVTRKDYDTYLQIGQIVAELPKITAMRRATLRRDLMRDIYFESQKSHEESPLVDLIYRYNPVLGADEKRALVVTRSGYLSLLASNLFVVQQAGLDPISAKQIDESVEKLRAAYPKLSEKEKQYLANAEANWIKLITMWQAWDTDKRRQRMQWAGVYKITNPDEVPKVARDLEHLAGFDLTGAQAQQMLEMQLAISNLEYMRMMVGSYTTF